MSDCRYGVSPVNYPDPDPGQKNYSVLNGSTYIVLLSYFIKVYITYAMFLVYLLQKLYYST